jgi:hypothetical protein
MLFFLEKWQNWFCSYRINFFKLLFRRYNFTLKPRMDVLRRTQEEKKRGSFGSPLSIKHIRN